MHSTSEAATLSDSREGRVASEATLPPRHKEQNGPSPSSINFEAKASLGELQDDTTPNAKSWPLPDVTTIPLYDFDLPLEMDLPYGSRISAFNPAPYEKLRTKLEQWFPGLCRQEDKDNDRHPLSSCASQDGAPKEDRTSAVPESTVISRRPSKALKAGSGTSARRNGKGKSEALAHLEVEFVPQVVTASDLLLPRNSEGLVNLAWSFSKPVQAFAVYALAPPDYKPGHSEMAREASAGPEGATDTVSDLGSEDDADHIDRLLLGHIVPSAFKDPAHPLAHTDPSLLSKQWVQLYGEVTISSPFLPPELEVFGPDAFEPSNKRGVTTSAGPFIKSEVPLVKAEHRSKSSTDHQHSTDEDNVQPLVRPHDVPSTRLLGVLSVQVGLERIALQYGAGDTAVDGFVATNEDLKDTGAEGSLGLARALKKAIPAVVDWKHSFVELDMHSHTYWDRNESYYELPSKQSTLARHLVLKNVVPVDLPPSAKSPSKKRKRPSNSAAASLRGAHSRRSYSDENDAFVHTSNNCGCPDCRRQPVLQSPTPKSLRPKTEALPLGEEVTDTDPRLGDHESERFLPLDTNIASLLEACRPPANGPMVYPPSDMIRTPLLGYQARCVAWMIKRETVVDEDVGHLMPNWFPLRCKDASHIRNKRMQLEAERAALIDAMQRGVSRSRRNAIVRNAQAVATGIAMQPAAASKNDAGSIIKDPHHDVLVREPFIDPIDLTFYLDHVSGMLSLRRFSCHRNEPGGALCESMGLGKTIESLSLIASRPRPDRADLLSYDTSRSARLIAKLDPSERPFVSKATLVVCPAALVEQWMDEIRKHFRSRNNPDVVISDDALGGVGSTAGDSTQQPGVVRFRHADFAWDIESSRDHVRALAKERLTQPDIVVTTYEELAFQLSESHRVPRSANQVRTPLLEVLFWRILLDEAQIVAGASGKATEMVHELWRSNCWMVTGTPVTKGIRDILGIFAFLDHDPLAAPRFFRDIIQDPFSKGCVEGIRRLRAILPRYLWRHTQAHVAEEIVLPPCKSEVLELDLKHIERLFYDKEVSKYRQTFAKRAAQGIATVSQPAFLVTLRQLLSHPQIADQLMFSQNFSRHSFAELFRQFCQQAQSELDAIRMQIVTTSLQLVWGHEFYEQEMDKRRWRGGRKVLHQPDDFRKVLSAALRVADMALEDQSLARTAPYGRVAAKEPGAEVGGSDVPVQQENTESVSVSGSNGEGAASPAHSKMLDQQAEAEPESSSRINLTWEEASYWLRVLLQGHDEARKGQVAGERDAIETPARWDPERPSRTFFEKEFRNAADKSVDLKDPRFHLVVQDASVEDMDVHELMAQIEADRQAQGQDQVSTEPSSKKQRKEAGIEPGLLKKSRLRGNASQRKKARVWLYKPKERLETTQARLSQQQEALPGKEHELAFLKQKLVEVQSRETNSERSGASEPCDPSTAAGSTVKPSTAECLICFEAQEQIGVLPCYHSFCTDCIETLCKDSYRRSDPTWSDRRRPRCPACRLPFHPDRVTRVMEQGRPSSNEDENNVIGDWSGKISGVIKDLKNRLEANPSHKAVIFSHWPKMLAFVRDALVQNEIAAVLFGRNEATQAEALRAIRDDDQVNVILVPFRASSGAAGLTLTSCDLAYLLEPALDAALEAQAVGRIHRIGQRRETTIIRVKMKDTIEDAVMRIADERSQRGMALATHLDPNTDTTSDARAEASNRTTIAEHSAASSSGTTAAANRGEAIYPAPAAMKTAEAANPLSVLTASDLRKRSIKSSVAASVGSARDSDAASLTMAEVGLILGFDVDEEKRKAKHRRESLYHRMFDDGPVRPSWIDRLTENDLEALEQELDSEDERGEGGGEGV